MDVLSDVIATMRSGSPRSVRVEWQGPWGQHFVSVPGAAFQVIVQGSCWLFPPDAEPVELGVGDLVFLPHGRSHGLADDLHTPLTEPDCDPIADPRFGSRFTSAVVGDGGTTTVTLCGAYQLDPARAHPLLRDLPEVILLRARTGCRAQLRGALDLLGAELRDPRPGADTLVPALLDVLLLYILRAWFDEQSEQGASSGWAAALRDPAISAALHGMHQHPARPWTVAELGAVAGLSRAAFARRFGALIGRPPLGYLTWWRMFSAARMLRDSDAPLRTVAEQVGYTSEFAFAAAFKREFGTSPGVYRRL